MAVRAIRRTSALQRSAGYAVRQPGTWAIVILSIAAIVDLADLLLAVGGICGRGLTNYKIWKANKRYAKKKENLTESRRVWTTARSYQGSDQSNSGVETRRAPIAFLGERSREDSGETSTGVH